MTDYTDREIALTREILDIIYALIGKTLASRHDYRCCFDLDTELGRFVAFGHWLEERTQDVWSIVKKIEGETKSN